MYKPVIDEKACMINSLFCLRLGYSKGLNLRFGCKSGIGDRGCKGAKPSGVAGEA